MRTLCYIAILCLARAADLSKNLETILDEFQGVGLTAWSVDTTDGAVCAQGAAGRKSNQNLVNNAFTLTGDSRHQIGSVTKSMTATMLAMIFEHVMYGNSTSSLLQAADENQRLTKFVLGWDTTLADALPNIVDHVYLNVTLRDLVSMFSGIPYGPVEQSDEYGVCDYPINSKGIREERRLATEFALQIEPLSQPGTSYEYTNWNYIIAGHIIEETLDTTWEEALQNMIFEPLGMKMDISDMFGTVATDTAPWPHFSNELIPCNPFLGPCDVTAVYGPAGTVSVPVAAMARYLSWHVECHNGRDTRLLSQQACQELHTPPRPDIEAYALGWECVYDFEWAEGPACAHSGSNGMTFYMAWIIFGIDRVFVSYANTQREVDWGMMESAFGLTVETFLDGNETCTAEWESSYYQSASTELPAVSDTSTPTSAPTENDIVVAPSSSSGSNAISCLVIATMSLISIL